MSFHAPEKYRVLFGDMGSDAGSGNNGVFIVKNVKLKRSLTCISSDGLGWEHVSVSLYNRCPTWEEMCIIKALFWDSDDCVVQYHPPADDYINNCSHCLHLWRPITETIPTPHWLLVGIK